MCHLELDRWSASVSMSLGGSSTNLSISSSSLGMDDTLGDALAVKVGEQVDEVEVLEEQRTIGANALPGIGIADWCAVGRCVDGLLAVAVRRGRLLVVTHCCWGVLGAG